MRRFALEPFIELRLSCCSAICKPRLVGIPLLQLIEPRIDVRCFAQDQNRIDGFHPSVGDVHDGIEGHLTFAQPHIVTEDADGIFDHPRRANRLEVVRSHASAISQQLCIGRRAWSEAGDYPLRPRMLRRPQRESALCAPTWFIGRSRHNNYSSTTTQERLPAVWAEER